MGKKRMVSLLVFLALLSSTAVWGFSTVWYAEEYVYTNPGCRPCIFGYNTTYPLNGTFNFFEVMKVGGHTNHESEGFDGKLTLFVGSEQTATWYFAGETNSYPLYFYHNFEGKTANWIFACGCSWDFHQPDHSFSAEFNRNTVVSKIDRKLAFEDLGEVGRYFKTLSSFYNTTGWKIKVKPFDNNSLVWLGEEDSYAVKETTDLTTHVYACADTNNNGLCDGTEGSFISCNNNGGDWFRGYCCGINYTSCQYVKSIPFTKQDCTSSPYRKTTCTNWQDNLSINAICGNNSQGKWEWVPAEEIGEIRIMNCPNGSVVGNGTAILSCEGGNMSGAITPFEGFKTINAGSVSHEYSCKNKEIYECGGKTGPFSSLNGVETGATNPSYTGETYYCASDGDWTKDLDIKDNESCTAAGFTWTGSLCCSEADDAEEYYNDPAYPNATGGCWDKQPVNSGEFSPDSERVINYHGQFFGCNVSNNLLLSLIDERKQPPDNWLVNNSISKCGAYLVDIQPGGLPNARCHPSGEWEFTDELGGTIMKSIKWTGLAPKDIQVSGCCAYDQCWDGKKCRPLESYYRVADEGFVCRLPEQ